MPHYPHANSEPATNQRLATKREPSVHRPANTRMRFARIVFAFCTLLTALTLGPPARMSVRAQDVSTQNAGTQTNDFQHQQTKNFETSESFETFYAVQSERLLEWKLDEVIESCRRRTDHNKSTQQRQTEEGFLLAIQAWAFAKNFRDDQALRAVELAIATEDLDGRAWTLCAKVMCQFGDFQRAKTLAEKAIERLPNHGSGYEGRAHAHLAEGDLLSALRDAELSLKHSPRRPTAHYLYATLLAQTDQSSKAQSSFQRALDLAPNYLGALMDRAFETALRHGYESATADIKKALQIAPHAGWIQSSAGMLRMQTAIHGQKGSTDQAEVDRGMAQINKTIRLTPNCLYVKSDLAYALLLEKKYDEAIRLNQELIKLRPNFAGTYMRLAQIYDLSERPEKALEIITQAQKKTPKHYRLYFYGGVVEQNRENHREAVDYFTKSLQRLPKHIYSLSLRSYSLEKIGQFEAALRDYDQLIEWVPNDGSYYARRANVYRALGLLDKARSDQEKAIELGFESL